MDESLRTAVISARDWQQAMSLAAAPPVDRILVAAAGFQGTNRMLSRGLHIIARTELESWLRRWSELIVIAPDMVRSSADLLEFLQTAKPHRTHRITAVGLGMGSEAGWLHGIVWTLGTMRMLEQLEVAGPRVRRWQLHRDLGRVSEREQNRDVPERWSRTAGALGEANWSRLNSTAIAVVGCGRTGSLIASSLALLGVKRLVLIDPDRIEAGNLDAMTGVTADDVGHKKVKAVAQHLTSLRPDLIVTGYVLPAHRRRASESLVEVDLIITAVDDDSARLCAARVSSQYLKPHLDVGTGVFQDSTSDRVMGADIRYMLPGEGCLECCGGLRRHHDAEYELNRRPSELRRAGPASWRDERAGSLITLNSVAVGVALQLYVDSLAERFAGSRWMRLEWTPDGQVTSQTLRPDFIGDCTTCGRLGLGDFVPINRGGQ